MMDGVLVTTFGYFKTFFCEEWQEEVNVKCYMQN